MMKKHGYSIVLQSVLLCSLLLLIPMIHPVSVNRKTIQQTSNQIIEYCINDLFFYEAQKLDPTYQWVILDADMPIDEETRKNINAALDHEFSYQYDKYFLADTNFHYQIKVNGKTHSQGWDASIRDEDKKKAILSATIQTDDKGEVLPIHMNSDSSFALSSNYDYLENLVSDTIFSIVDQEWAQKHPDIKQYYHVQFPKNAEMEIYIPETLVNNQDFLYNTFVDVGPLGTQVLLTIAVILVLVTLISFFTPLSQEYKSKSFFHFTHIKFEWMIIMMMVIACLAFVAYSAIFIILDGDATYFFRVNKISEFFFLAKFALGVLFYVLFMYTAYMIGYIKHFFSLGIVSYCKQQTYVSKLITAFKRINFVDFKGKFSMMCLLFVIVNLILMVYIHAFAMDYRILFLILYTCLMYGFIMHIYKQIKRQYEDTLRITKQLADGDFDVEPIVVPTFQELYDNLLQIKNGFSKSLEEGIQSQNVKTELISNVSHDLKTPLTGLKNYVELLQDDQDLSHREDYIKKIAQYTNRLDHLIVDLFDVSKANSGALEVEKQRVDLCEMIKQVQAEYAMQWLEQDLTTVYKMPEKACMVDIDPSKMVRVFENLIQNINRYALEHTRVFIQVEDVQDTYRISYKNISKAPLDFNPDEITERFIRGDKSRHEIGSGLGLAIVKSFTEIQDGTFTIEIDGDVFKAILTLPKV